MTIEKIDNEKSRIAYETWAAPRGFMIESYQGLNGEWFFSDDDTQLDFETWQASRAALVIKLPEPCEYAYPQGDYAKGHRIGKRDVVAAIEAAGLKVKS